MHTEYIVLINELKQSIIQSRYAAARIAAEKWGVKVIEQISVDLQSNCRG